MCRVKSEIPDHYATLELERDCSDAEIRTAYRNLAKKHHPDVNPGSPDAMARIQALNAAYEALGDSARRRVYDEKLTRSERGTERQRGGGLVANITQDVHIAIQDLLRGASLNVHVTDPANPRGMESYELVIPPETAPGTRFRLKRAPPFENGCVIVRVKVRPDARFKARGSDLRCDLKISAHRATLGGMESVRGATGQFLRVKIPPHVARREVIRIHGEGLPKARGGRGDLLIRITYRPDVRISRAARH